MDAFSTTATRVELGYFATKCVDVQRGWLWQAPQVKSFAQCSWNRYRYDMIGWCFVLRPGAYCLERGLDDFGVRVIQKSPGRHRGFQHLRKGMCTYFGLGFVNPSPFWDNETKFVLDWHNLYCEFSCCSKVSLEFLLRLVVGKPAKSHCLSRPFGSRDQMLLRWTGMAGCNKVVEAPESKCFFQGSGPYFSRIWSCNYDMYQGKCLHKWKMSNRCDQNIFSCLLIPIQKI